MIISQKTILFFNLLNSFLFAYIYTSEYNKFISYDQPCTVIAILNKNEPISQIHIQNPLFDCFLESNTRFFVNLLRIKKARTPNHQSTDDPFLCLAWETINTIFSYLYTDPNIFTQNYHVIHYLDDNSFTNKPLPSFSDTFNMPDNTTISLKFFSARQAFALLSPSASSNQVTCENFLIFLKALKKNYDIFFHQFRKSPDVQKYLKIRDNAVVSEEEGKWLVGKKEKYNNLDDTLFKGSVYVNTCYIDNAYIFLELYNDRQHEKTASENISNFFNLFYGHVILICKRSEDSLGELYPPVKRIWLSRVYEPNSFNHNTYKTSQIYNITNIEKNVNGIYSITLHDTRENKCFEINPLSYESNDIFIKSDQFPICNPICWEKIIIAYIEQDSKKTYLSLLEQQKLALEKQQLEKLEKNKQETKSAHFKILAWYTIIECLLYIKFGLKRWHTIPVPLCAFIHYLCYDLATLSRDIHQGYNQMEKERHNRF